MKRSQQVVTEIQVQVADIFRVRRGVAGANGGQTLRLPADQVIDDGKIMRRQVPEHVDVSLEQTQVDPDAVDVVDPAQLSRIDERFDLANGGTEEKGVID